MHTDRHRPLRLAAVVGAVALTAVLTFQLGQGAALRTAGAANPSTSRSNNVTTRRATTAAASGAVKAIEQAVSTGIAFVEKERGLHFKRRPTVTILAGDAFVKRVDTERKSDPEYAKDMAEMNGLLRSFGFVTGAGDPEKLIDSLMAGGVAGFYVPETKELVVRSGAIGPSTRITIVHELVHALEDQHFGLDRPELDKLTDDSPTAFSFLAEGSARHIENRYRASLSDADSAAADAEEMKMSTEGDLIKLMFNPAYTNAFPFLLSILMAPYEQGKLFVADVVASGGTAALDKAFAKPPVTTEQATDLAAYRSGEPALLVPVPEVPAGAKVLGSGVIGEAGFNALIATPATLSNPSKIDAAARRVGGDAYIIWNQSTSVCARIDVVMDTRKDLTELRTALSTLARTSGAATAAVTDHGSGLRYTTCSKR